MDGTLLDEHKRMPAGLDGVLAQLDARGVYFCPASGRQLATLRRDVPIPSLPFIAENGGHVVHGATEILSVEMPRRTVAGLLQQLAWAIDGGLDAGVVICGKRSAYLPGRDVRFIDEARLYYTALEVVSEPVEVPDDTVLKLAVYHPRDAARHVEPLFAETPEGVSAVTSARNWFDIMPAATSKGAALIGLQRALGVSREQTMAFGDYLNDLELLDAAEHSYAMANAHPDVLARARHTAPPNTEDGVLRTIREVLGLR